MKELKRAQLILLWPVWPVAAIHEHNGYFGQD
jgi:hypothetical protein